MLFFALHHHHAALIYMRKTALFWFKSSYKSSSVCSSSKWQISRLSTSRYVFSDITLCGHAEPQTCVEKTTTPCLQSSRIPSSHTPRCHGDKSLALVTTTYVGQNRTPLEIKQHKQHPCSRAGKRMHSLDEESD